MDIGGGTGQVSLKIRSDLGLTKPVVCVDPSQEMLDVAKKNGAITIKATAEEFFATKPEYPLKVVLMSSCTHHFKDIELVFTKLAEFMPDDGVCFVAEYPAESLPMFEAAKQVHISTIKSQYFRQFVESVGFKWKMVSQSQMQEVNKSFWYDSIRNRYDTALMRFTDEELEKGIAELEEKFKGQEVLHADMTMDGCVIQKK